MMHPEDRIRWRIVQIEDEIKQLRAEYEYNIRSGRAMFGPPEEQERLKARIVQLEAERDNLERQLQRYREL
jgi:predicted RNase H-like nuclease (RuvC/YqgF family)